MRTLLGKWLVALAAVCSLVTAGPVDAASRIKDVASLQSGRVDADVETRDAGEQEPELSDEPGRGQPAHQRSIDRHRRR